MNSASVWMSSLVFAAAGGWFAATMFAAPATSKEPRFPQLTMEQLNEAQKPLGEQIMKVSSVGLGGPYNPMILSPGVGQGLYDLFYYLRWQTSVPTKLNEFAILIIGRQWRSQVEWYAHAPLAAKAGLAPEIIAELKASKRPSGMAEDEAVVYDFVTELTTTQKVSDETYARAKKVFNDQQLVDLTAVAGNYVMVAMLLVMILGLGLFLGVHTLTTQRELRGQIIAAAGEGGYKIAYALVSAAGLALIVWGFAYYRATGWIDVWTPPTAFKHITVALMLPAVILVVASYIRGRIYTTLKHPMLAGVKLWAAAHLLANGDLGSIILFGSFLGWAVFDRISLKRRTDSGGGPAPA